MLPRKPLATPPRSSISRCPGLRRGVASTLAVALLALGAMGCARDARAKWRPGETMPARAAIDAQWHIADQHVGQGVRDRKISGAAVVIVTPDGWGARGFGWATSQRQVNERTVFEIGSISKVFTGTLLADMALRRQVSLTQPAQALLPGRTRMPPSATRPITLMDLSTHMSGMPRLPPGMKAKDKADPYASFTVEDLYASLGRTTLEREPGVKKEYSNYAVGLLGQLLTERADKDSYEELLTERILGPLGMTDTSVELRDDQLERFAWGHGKNNERAAPWNIRSLAGAGGLRSTGRDMAIFAQAHLRPDSPISAAAQEALIPRGVPGSGDWDGGLGWAVKRDRSMAWHNGATGGYHAWIGLDFRHQLGVVVLCNTSIDDVDAWGTKILAALRQPLGRGGVAALDEGDEHEVEGLTAQDPLLEVDGLGVDDALVAVDQRTAEATLLEVAAR